MTIKEKVIFNNVLTYLQEAYPKLNLMIDNDYLIAKGDAQFNIESNNLVYNLDKLLKIVLNKK